MMGWQSAHYKKQKHECRSKKHAVRSSRQQQSEAPALELDDTALIGEDGSRTTEGKYKDLENGMYEKTIYVKTWEGRTITAEISSEHTTIIVKSKIEAKTGIQTDDQQLVVRGKVLMDSTPLNDYGLSGGETIDMTAKLLGGTKHKSLGELCRKTKKAFEMRYEGRNIEYIETWLRNIVVLIPQTKKVIDGLEKQTRGICVQSVLDKWYCGCLTILLEKDLRNVEKRDKSWCDIHTFGFDGGRRATEISTAIRLMAAAAREWRPELGVITCSMHLKQAFDIVSSIGSKYDICFQETRISGTPFDNSIKQGGKESPCLLKLMMRSVIRVLQEERKRMRMGVKIRNSVRRQEEDRISHTIFADNCYLFAESKNKS